MTVGESTYFYVQNIRGDVVALMDSNGSQVASYIYDTWGVPTISNPNNLPNPFLYQGSYATFYDDEFGMYGMGARHYNPITMRFVSRDLNHGTLTNTMSQNLYIYCYNNPLGFKDPSGFSPVSCGVAGGIVDTGMPASMTSGNDGRSTPIPDSAPDTKDPKLSKEQQKLWDWCEKQGIKFESKREFLDIWNTAKEVQEKMLEFEGIENNDELDFSIAFWVCYWNDKAGLGLNMGGLVELAKFIQGIAYVESTYGTDRSEKAKQEGLMGVEANTLRNAIDNGWAPKALESEIYSYKDSNNNTQWAYKNGKGLWQDGQNYNASLMAGIGIFLKCMGTHINGVGNRNLENFRKLIPGKLNPDGGNLDSYAKAMTAYGGNNGFVQNYFGGKVDDNWVAVNPYGNGVKSIVENGTIKKSKDGKPIRVVKLP